MPVTPADLAATMRQRTARRQAAEEAERLAIVQTLQRQLPALAQQLSLGRVWLIGSAAWGGFGLRSDVDLVLEHGDDLAMRLQLDDCLGPQLARLLDLLPLTSLPATFQQRVLREGLRVA